jgi:acetyltransferase-like isoleucine patch superfamily enzyme
MRSVPEPGADPRGGSPTQPPAGWVLPPNPYHPLALVIGDPEIGPGTWIGPFTVIDGSGGLVIGAGCDISCGAQIYTHSTVARCVSGRRHDRVDRAPTRLGERVFVGANAVVLMGVTVGDGAVIGAGAVVTRDVAPYTVVTGVPARVTGRVRVEGDRVAIEAVGQGP